MIAGESRRISARFSSASMRRRRVCRRRTSRKLAKCNERDRATPSSARAHAAAGADCRRRGNSDLPDRAAAGGTLSRAVFQVMAAGVSVLAGNSAGILRDFDASASHRRRLGTGAAAVFGDGGADAAADGDFVYSAVFWTWEALHLGYR